MLMVESLQTPRTSLCRNHDYFITDLNPKSSSASYKLGREYRLFVTDTIYFEKLGPTTGGRGDLPPFLTLQREIAVALRRHRYSPGKHADSTLTPPTLKPEFTTT